MKTAGYSGTPLYKKLGIKPGQRAWFTGNPSGYEDELRNIGDFQRVQKLGKELDFLHFFTASRKALAAEISKLRAAMNANGMLWVSWPKKAAGVPTDLDENIVREIGLKAGLVDVKVCAVDETWSGLKFVFRLKDR
ncbi:MAG: DUF3052 domain-containing protein [Acidobacteria bacterium]|nr:MAG: DUF3052 domain-containing protein [Acidobacteriota bacterium]